MKKIKNTTNKTIPAGAPVTASGKNAATMDRKCRVCGCTDDDCRQCIEAQGRSCHWVEEDLCSRCQAESGD